MSIIAEELDAKLKKLDARAASSLEKPVRTNYSFITRSLALKTSQIA